MLKMLKLSEIQQTRLFFTINAAHRNILEMTVGSDMMYRVSFFPAWPIRAGPKLCQRCVVRRLSGRFNGR
jgi:hypothetical protein